jgi:membrane-associated phospholipid phosphatase
MVIVYFAALGQDALRVRFFTAYFAMWIFGGLTALALPSLGPVYTRPEWFETVVKPHASILQRRLELHYFTALVNPEHSKRFIYEGIAAFPSLHVGIAALFAFFLWERNRMLGGALFAYTAIVQLGAVLLGWHYSVDGVFAFLMAFLLHRLSRWIVRDGKDAIADDSDALTPPDGGASEKDGELKTQEDSFIVASGALAKRKG